MIKCPNCSQQIEDNDKLLFCPFCLSQIKCEKCKEALIQGAIGCIACGTPLASPHTSSSQINEIEFERKGDSVKFKTKFTDTVGKDLVSTFGSIAGVNQFIKKNPFNNIPVNKSIQSISQNSDDSFTVVEEVAVEDSDISEALNRVLTLDGERLIFQTNSFKEQNKLDKEIRISLLLLLGYKTLLNLDDIKRSVLTDTLQHYKLNSGGFRNWIVKSNEIGRKNKGIIFLTPDGRDKAIEVLIEISDKTVTKGAVSFGKANLIARKKSSNGSADSSRRASGALSYLKVLIEEGYFSERRKLGDIAKHLKEKRAVAFSTAEIGTPIVKLLVPKDALEREKGESGQYEYFVR